jgi:hypothetical protein
MSEGLLRTENAAALDLQRMQIGAPLADSLSQVIPPQTSYSFGNYFINNWNEISSGFSQRIPNVFQEPTSIMKVIGISIFILLIITACIFIYNYVQSQTEGFKVNNSDLQLQKAKDFTNYLISARIASNHNIIPESPMTLLNLQMPTFKQISYIGNNLFDNNQGVLQQLKSGSRTFFCQIDYIESEALNNNKFCKVYEPCFIWKDDNDKLISKNSSSLQETFKYIAEYGFSDAVINYKYPIVLMLHFVRFPYAKTDDKYIDYLSKVSKSLEIINPYLLSGGYYRASNENDLFKGDFLSMGQSIIIGTNIDTTLFQKRKVEQYNDLDYKIHFHYYENVDENVDQTAVAVPGTNYFALIFNIDTLLNMDVSKFTQIYKNKFIIVKTHNSKNPTIDQVNKLLNTFNVNIVLYDYFSSSINDSRSVISLYGNTTYKIKSDL